MKKSKLDKATSRAKRSLDLLDYELQRIQHTLRHRFTSLALLDAAWHHITRKINTCQQQYINKKKQNSKK